MCCCVIRAKFGLKIPGKIEINGAISIKIEAEIISRQTEIKSEPIEWQNLIYGQQLNLSTGLNINEQTDYLEVRPRLPGDKIKLPVGSKKLKKFFIDNHVPTLVRNVLPLIIEDNNIVWYPHKPFTKTKTMDSKYIKINITLKI